MLELQYVSSRELVIIYWLWFSLEFVCQQFLFYLRGVSFARVIVSRNGNLSVYKSALFLFSSGWKLSYFVRYR